MKKSKPTQRCSDCGFRIRGKNHREGIHHRTVIDGHGKIPQRTCPIGKK